MLETVFAGLRTILSNSSKPKSSFSNRNLTLCYLNDLRLFSVVPTLRLFPVICCQCFFSWPNNKTANFDFENLHEQAHVSLVARVGQRKIFCRVGRKSRTIGLGILGARPLEVRAHAHRGNQKGFESDKIMFNIYELNISAEFVWKSADYFRNSIEIYTHPSTPQQFYGKILGNIKNLCIFFWVKFSSRVANCHTCPTSNTRLFMKMKFLRSKLYYIFLSEKSKECKYIKSLHTA